MRLFMSNEEKQDLAISVRPASECQELLFVPFTCFYHFKFEIILK
jgi:hypothetical protein